MRKTTISIGSKDFDITLDEEFASFFDKEFSQSFGDKKNIGTKDLLWAYVQKIHDEYVNKKEIEKLYKRLEDI